MLPWPWQNRDGKEGGQLVIKFTEVDLGYLIRCLCSLNQIRSGKEAEMGNGG